MSVADIFCIALLITGAIIGFKRGLLMELISLIAVFVGLIGAVKVTVIFSDEVLNWIPAMGKSAPVWVFIVAFILLIILVFILGKSLKGVLDMTLFGDLDNFLGALMGMLKWALMVSCLLWVFKIFEWKIPEDFTHEAVIYPYIVNLSPKVFEMIASLVPVFNELIEKAKGEISITCI